MEITKKDCKTTYYSFLVYPQQNCRQKLSCHALHDLITDKALIDCTKKAELRLLINKKVYKSYDLQPFDRN